MTPQTATNLCIVVSVSIAFIAISPAFRRRQFLHVAAFTVLAFVANLGIEIAEYSNTMKAWRIGTEMALLTLVTGWLHSVAIAWDLRSRRT